MNRRAVGLSWNLTFFKGVHIPLSTSDHCLSIIEHDHTTRNMPINLILMVLNVLKIIGKLY